MEQQGNGRRNVHHCLAKKSEDSQEGNGLRPEVHHVDLIMGEHRVEESRKGGTRPAHRASAKNWTSVATLSMEAWDAGQTVVLPHSLKIVARAELTLFKASGLSMMDRSTTGATAGGEQETKARASSPFPSSLAPWQWEGGSARVGLEAEVGA